MAGPIHIGQRPSGVEVQTEQLQASPNPRSAKVLGVVGLALVAAGATAVALGVAGLALIGAQAAIALGAALLVAALIVCLTHRAAVAQPQCQLTDLELLAELPFFGEEEPLAELPARGVAGPEVQPPIVEVDDDSVQEFFDAEVDPRQQQFAVEDDVDQVFYDAELDQEAAAVAQPERQLTDLELLAELPFAEGSEEQALGARECHVDMSPEALATFVQVALAANLLFPQGTEVVDAQGGLADGNRQRTVQANRTRHRRPEKAAQRNRQSAASTAPVQEVRRERPAPEVQIPPQQGIAAFVQLALLANVLFLEGPAVPAGERSYRLPAARQAPRPLPRQVEQRPRGSHHQLRHR